MLEHGGMHAETSSTLSLSAPPINRRRLVGLLQEMLGVPSPCGKERRLAIFLAEVMRGMGLRVSCQHVRRRRLNVLGVRPGRAGAPALLLAGRLDTPPPGTDEARCPRRGGADSEFVYGPGAGDMLGANACYLEALRTLHEHGFEPAGDLIVAFVVGGPEEGLGTRKLLEGIPGASRFILGRPTGLAVRACPSEFHVGSEAPRAMAAAHLAAAGAPSTAEHYGKLESWDADAMLLAKAGWDGAVYGPGDRGDDPSGQRVAIASLATAARVYAAASVKLAGTAHGFGAPLQVTESRAHRRTRLESPPWARSLR